MVGRSKTRLYSSRTLDIFPGSLWERSQQRLRDGAADKTISYDLKKGGPLVEEFPDDEFRRDDFSRKGGRSIYYHLRQVILTQNRIGDPIPNKELEDIAILAGHHRLLARITIRDAWKMGASRRFIRGLWDWSTSGESTGGKKFGVHYILGRTDADR